MNKRYQVFVSSTYADLREERSRVIQTLMEMDCIPAGMELFSAADEEQWAFIRKVIDDCDYYILIIGGRYGSTTPEGVSYTEKEYDYAIEKGLKVLAFIHEKPDDIPVGKSDIDPKVRGRLMAFRDKVSKGRLVKFWNAAEELPGLVSLSLTKTIKTHPAVGWVRADQVSSTEVLTELNELRKRNQELERVASQLKVPERKAAVPNLAGLDEQFTVKGTHWHHNAKYNWECAVTWGDLFALIAPYLLQHSNDEYVKAIYSSNLHQIAGGGAEPASNSMTNRFRQSRFN
ncbi:MAG: DUF4062 domain-containing protein [Deltaproteobacteria bacterium]|nr:DUF4062 domain-containing protein [Deltaproteobacteria bacterium]